jgi:hypothetical protein
VLGTTVSAYLAIASVIKKNVLLVLTPSQQVPVLGSKKKTLQLGWSASQNDEHFTLKV